MQNFDTAILAPGLTIRQWHPSQLKDGEEARAFCLSTIKQTYGYDYRADWHTDLDSLLLGEESWYAPAKGGGFFIIRNHAGEVVGTGGIYSLVNKQQFAGIFGDRYPRFDMVGSVVRTYLHPDYRGNALSRTLVPMLEHIAKQYGYAYLNLHCEAAATRLRRHWESFGYVNFVDDGSTAHYDKLVHNLR